MTIGPAPMIRMEEMSVRFGIGCTPAVWEWAHKKRARELRVLRAGGEPEARARRCLDQNPGRGKSRGKGIQSRAGRGWATLPPLARYVVAFSAPSRSADHVRQAE